MLDTLVDRAPVRVGARSHKTGAKGSGRLMKLVAERTLTLLGAAAVLAALTGCVAAPLKSFSEFCTEDGFVPGTAEFESCVAERKARNEQVRRAYDLSRPRDARP